MKNPFEGFYVTEVNQLFGNGLKELNVYNLSQLNGISIYWSNRSNSDELELCISFVDDGFMNGRFVIKGDEAERFADKYDLPRPSAHRV